MITFNNQGLTHLPLLYFFNKENATVKTKLKHARNLKTTNHCSNLIIENNALVTDKKLELCMVRLNQPVIFQRLHKKNK